MVVLRLRKEWETVTRFQYQLEISKDPRIESEQVTSD